jgi:hypothetical protein
VSPQALPLRHTRQQVLVAEASGERALAGDGDERDGGASRLDGMGGPTGVVSLLGSGSPSKGLASGSGGAWVIVAAGLGTALASTAFASCDGRGRGSFVGSSQASTAKPSVTRPIENEGGGTIRARRIGLE